jgi:hypothetical protein
MVRQLFEVGYYNQGFGTNLQWRTQPCGFTSGEVWRCKRNRSDRDLCQ